MAKSVNPRKKVIPMRVHKPKGGEKISPGDFKKHKPGKAWQGTMTNAGGASQGIERRMARKRKIKKTGVASRTIRK